jgi:tRNA uridine 5-carboxymethylaminomethyl modification enzyme
MFTSRAEYRLALRQDNADLRLTARGAAAGVVLSAQRVELAARKARGAADARVALEAVRLGAAEWHARGFAHVKPDGPARSAAEMMAMPETELAPVEALLVERGALPAAGIDPIAREEVAISTKYANYLRRQETEVARWRAHDGAQIPADMDYASLPSLSNEEVEKLSRARPPTLGDAARIQGITPNSLTYVLAYLRQRRTPGSGNSAVDRRVPAAAAAAEARLAAVSAAPTGGAAAGSAS